MATRNAKRVLALCGGVGGAKLALGLSKLLAGDQLTIVVNTGDDFEHLGLHISPDIDTVTYTLAGLSDQDKGWGRANESWSFMQALRELGGEDWFSLGDKDLALHTERTRRLKAGQSLSEVTADVNLRLGVAATIAPMSDDLVGTIVKTDVGRLAFQHYFVRDKCAPKVLAVEFSGADSARPSTAFRDALKGGATDAIVFCPSNPYLSIDPILAINGARDLLQTRTAPAIAVSPIVGGQAVKGPTAKIMIELGLDVSALSIAKHYGTLIDGYIIDHADEEEMANLKNLGLAVRCAPTVMRSLEDRVELARHVLDFSDELKQSRESG